MRRFGKVLKGRRGVTLIELLVVVAILGILATITAVAVTGTTQRGRAAGKQADQNAVNDAVSGYSAQHPRQLVPTLDGCRVDEGLQSSFLVCRTDETPTEQFTVDESDVGIDVNGDGDAVDADVKVKAILWDQSFTGDDGTARTFDSFVDIPRHAFDLVAIQDGWKTGRTRARIEDTNIVRNPFGDAAQLDACQNTSTGDEKTCPVWVINEDGKVIALLPDGTY